MKKSFLNIFLALLIFFPSHTKAERLMPDVSSGNVSIICGMDENGEGVQCNLKDHKCFKCLETKRHWITLGILASKKEVFKCVAGESAGKDCEIATNGGLSGDKYMKILYLSTTHKAGQQCIVSNFFMKYSNCYACIVVKTLISAFIKAGAQAYEVSRSAANAVALVCMMIWIAFFVFRNVTSFSAIQPMKMLQEFLVQCFKVVLALIIINSGISTILHYTLVPILSAGIDMADSIAASGNNISSEYTNGGQS